MRSTVREEKIAQEFWTGTGLADRFPREIETAVALKLPLTLVKVPSVNVDSVRRWLVSRRLRASLPPEQHELMGCLVAFRGFGVAFINGSDPVEEQRLTVAHETAHFLEDYLRPRRELLAGLGEGISEVLDGARAPTAAERANAVLAHLRVGVHVHLLPRRDASGALESMIDIVEDRADRLGLELVAPRRRVLEACRAAGRSFQSPMELAAILSLRFGLPGHAFAAYLARPIGRTSVPSFFEDIRSVLTAAVQSPHGKR